MDQHGATILVLDLNAFAMHTSLDTSETIASADFYTRENRTVAVLVDGDDEGDKRSKAVETWANKKKRTCPVISLRDILDGKSYSIEDFLELNNYVEAVVQA